MRILGAAALFLALTACGDDDDTADGTSAETASDGTEVPAAATSVAVTEAPAVPTAVESAAPPTSGSAAGEPFDFTSADGSDTITYPAEPTQQTQDQALPDGSTLPVTFTVLAAPQEAFVSAVVEYPQGVTADLQGAADGAIANSGGTLTDEQDIELAGRQGRELTADLGGQGTLIARLYVEGNRLWQVIYTAAGVVTAEDPAPAAFFDSFRFTEGG